MRTMELDDLAERLLRRDRARSLTGEHVDRLRDAILWDAALEVLRGLATYKFHPDRLREAYGDGTDLRDGRAQDIEWLADEVIKRGEELMPAGYVRAAIEGTRRTVELVALVADDGYQVPPCLFTLLCAAAGLVLRQRASSVGEHTVQRAWSAAQSLAHSLPAR